MSLKPCRVAKGCPFIIFFLLVNKEYLKLYFQLSKNVNLRFTKHLIYYDLNIQSYFQNFRDMKKEVNTKKYSPFYLKVIEKGKKTSTRHFVLTLENFKPNFCPTLREIEISQCRSNL